MTGRSLGRALSAAAAASIALALLIGGVGLFLIFDAGLDRRTADELNQTAKFLAGEVGFDAKGALVLGASPADPRYATAYGGLYWQVESAGREALRSRSLWDKTLALPAGAGTAGRHATIDLAGPDGGVLIAAIRSVKLRTPPSSPDIVIAVAMDRRELAASRAAVLKLLAPSLLALGLALTLAMTIFVHRALAPFRALRDDLRRMHKGGAERLPGGYATEVQPLVDDLNRLLALQQDAIGRARAQAGDMAHGLKTPLAVLDALARRIAGERPEIAAEIEEQSGAMDRQVARTLARARSAAASGIRRESAAVAPVAGRLVAALGRLPGSERLDWRLDIDPAAAYPATEDDLLEMLGTLLDNARKWGRSVVAVSARGSAAAGVILVEDDGPGMDAPDAASVERGRRWDEAAPGTGFGLAIARDLAEATGGRLTLGRSELGGLAVRIEWGPPVGPGRHGPVMTARYGAE